MGQVVFAGLDKCREGLRLVEKVVVESKFISRRTEGEKVMQ